MGIDIRGSRAQDHDYNYWYKRKPNTNDIESEKPTGWFASHDIQVLNRVPYFVNGMFKGKRIQVKIRTQDNLGFGTDNELEVDDWVLYGGELYRVDDLKPDDLNKNKQFNKVPRYQTDITLVK